MKAEDIELLENNDWIVECESPFEIRYKDGGAFASGLAAEIVLDELKRIERKEQKRVEKFKLKCCKTCKLSRYFKDCQLWWENSRGCSKCENYNEELGTKLEKKYER